MILSAGSGFIDFHVTMHNVTMISMKCELAHYAIINWRTKLGIWYYMEWSVNILKYFPDSHFPASSITNIKMLWLGMRSMESSYITSWGVLLIMNVLTQICYLFLFPIFSFGWTRHWKQEADGHATLFSWGLLHIMNLIDPNLLLVSVSISVSVELGIRGQRQEVITTWVLEEYYRQWIMLI